MLFATRAQLDEERARSAHVAALAAATTGAPSPTPRAPRREHRPLRPRPRPRTIQAQLDAVSPAFIGDAPRFGALQPRVLNAWALWEAKFGIVKRPPDVRRAFDAAFLPKPSKTD